MPYYGVANGHETGVYDNWSNCSDQVTGYSNSKFQKFSTKAEAAQFVADNRNNSGASNNYDGHYSSGSGSYGRNEAASSTGRNYESVQIANNTFSQGNNGYVQVFTDGSCEGNGMSNAAAGCGVYFGDNHPLNVSKPVRGRATNNSGEIQGACEAIRSAKDNGVTKLQINTDSKFLIDAATKWIPNWEKNGWKTSSNEEVKNKEDFQRLQEVCNGDIDVKWNHVKGHDGVLGNERADALAREGAKTYRRMHQ